MIFNQILSPRWAPQLVRLFGMKTIGSPVPTLAPEIAPSFDVNDREDATIAFLRQERLAGVSTAFAASVGNVNQLQLRNPSGSGMMIEIEHVMSNSTGTTVAGIVLTTSDLGTLVPAYLRDGRWLTLNGTISSAGIVSQSQPAATTLTYVTYRFPPSVLDYQPCKVVVPPGYGFMMATLAANIASAHSIQWRERPMAQEEFQTG